jgi:hypothetical protein
MQLPGYRPTTKKCAPYFGGTYVSNLRKNSESTHQILCFIGDDESNSKQYRKT